MPEARPAAVPHHDPHAAPALRPGWRVGLALVAWLVGTVWAMWQLSPELQATAAAVCRTARP